MTMVSVALTSTERKPAMPKVSQTTGAGCQVEARWIAAALRLSSFWQVAAIQAV